jgi:hypothetical protein
LLREEVGVAGAYSHRVDRQSTTVVELEGDDLEQVAGPIGTEEQRTARLVLSLLERVAHNRMFDRVQDVLVGDAVPARCAMNLHTVLV